MVFLLGLHVSQEGVELARAHRKGAVAALPVEAAVIGGEALDPFRDFFFSPPSMSACERVRGSVVSRWT